MSRDSFIFYRSFYEAIKYLPKEDKSDVLSAICEFALNDTDIELTVLPKALFTLIKPQLEAKKNSIDNGKKGGRPLLEESLLSVFGDTIPRTPNNNDHYLYLFKRISTGTYKIGETQDLFKRRLTIKVPTADLKIIHFVNVDSYKSLTIENDIKKKFKNNRLGGDWFEFNDEKLMELIEYFNHVKKLKNPPLEREREYKLK